jgi:AcrR family transcriptional regulator
MATTTRKRTVADRLTAEPARDPSAPIENVADLFTRRVESPSVRRILLAAVDNFSKYGFHASSTRDIAKRAKLSPAAVYVHFRSKEELLFTLVVIISEWVHERMQAAMREGGTPVELLRRLVQTHVASHAAMRTALFVAEYEFGLMNPVQRKKILKIRDALEVMFEDCLDEGTRQGVFTVPNLSITRVAIVSLCVTVLNWYSPKGELSTEEVGALYADLVLSMVKAVEPQAAAAKAPRRSAAAKKLQID